MYPPEQETESFLNWLVTHTTTTYNFIQKIKPGNFGNIILEIQSEPLAKIIQARQLMNFSWVVLLRHLPWIMNHKLLLAVQS